MFATQMPFTNIATPLNQEKTRQFNFPKAEKWEMDIIGNLVLNLYHRSIITRTGDWSVNKSEMRKEYLQLVTEDIRKKLKTLSGTDNIGTLLHRCAFLINTTRGSPYFKIRCKTLFDFRNNKLRELDNMKRNSDGIQQAITNEKDTDSILLNRKPIALEEENLEIDENEPKITLEYQGSTIQRHSGSFFPTNMSCYICEMHFSTMQSFEEHIQTHGEDTDFEFLTKMDKFNSSTFIMSYRLCKNSHNFCFEFESNLEDLIIDKIIIVQSRSFYYVHNMSVPYPFPETGLNRFFVDSHLFTRYVEQPIVLICHLKDSKDSRIIEQHHFMRSEEFPKVNFLISPYRLPNKKTFKSKLKLPDYFPSKKIQDALKNDFYYKNLMQTSNEFRDYVRNGKNLQPQTIAASLNILLQIEDIDTIQQYLCLKQKNVNLRSYGDEYSFQLKLDQGILLENILTVYDEVILTKRTDIFTQTEEILKLMGQNKSAIKRMENTFLGVIEAVNTGRISFKCDQKIDIHGLYTVICRPSRFNFRYQYRSLELLPTNMDFLKKFLFPAKVIPMPLSTITLDLYNKNLNAEQLQAVRNMAEGPRNDATYIIFGPPGTGKTTTLVEGILQILKKPNTKILVTASSNSACDEVALRLCKYLHHLDIKRVMVRIYSRSCEIRSDTIDDELLENSNMYNGQFYPDIEILHEYRVVICTLSVVAKLATGKFGRATVYTHLIIDEVAASMEVEALMAITTILTSKSCLIISGDNKQLGPILQSKRAKELGLDASLMDRLLARDCYRVDVDTGDYERSIQTRLVRNYRSHPAIVNLYSGLYYNHSLEAVAKPEDVSLCEIWHKSLNKQYPILFHAIYEPSISDNRSHSLYNYRELRVVMDYVKDLMYFGINGEPVKESDIGIISPYKKQYRRIQEELNLRKWFNIETGSVETFQGKEKNIIIVSFVRSGTNNLGFLDSARRLNVTLSRAKSYLILIGNPTTLSLNSDFEYIIKECERNNTLIGLNEPARNNLNKQATEHISESQEKLALLNKNMEQPQPVSVENKESEKVTELDANKHNSRKNIFTFKTSNDENSDKNDNKNNENNGNDKIMTAVFTATKYSKDYIVENATETLTGQNETCNETTIDSILKELPQVPRTSKSTIITFTKEQLLQLRTQYNNNLCGSFDNWFLKNKKDLFCFKNDNNTVANNNKNNGDADVAKQSIHISSESSIQNDNIGDVLKKDIFGDNNILYKNTSSSSSSFSASNMTVDAIKKPQVPRTSKPTIITFTKEQLLQLRTQYNNNLCGSFDNSFLKNKKDLFCFKNDNNTVANNNNNNGDADVAKQGIHMSSESNIQNDNIGDVLKKDKFGDNNILYKNTSSSSSSFSASNMTVDAIKKPQVFKELPQVTRTSKPTIITFTKEQLLQLRTQYNNNLCGSFDNSFLKNKKDLFCFKNDNNTVANNNNNNGDADAAKQSIHMSSESNIQNDNIGDVLKKDKFGDNNILYKNTSSSSSSFSASNMTVDAIKKPQVPRTSKSTIITFTKEQLLQLRIQHNNSLHGSFDDSFLKNKKDLFCFKNDNNTVANNNNNNGDTDVAKQSRNISSESNIQNDNIGDVLKKDKFGDNNILYKNTSSSSSFSASNMTADVIKKPPDSLGISPNPREYIKKKSIKNNDAEFKKIFRFAESETFKDKNINKKENSSNLSTLNNMNGKFTAFAKPFPYEKFLNSGFCTENSFKKSEQQKCLNTSETVQLKSKKENASVSKDNITNTITTNSKDNKPKANVYPVIRNHPSNTFTTMSNNNDNYLPSSSSSNDIFSNLLTSLNYYNLDEISTTHITMDSFSFDFNNSNYSPDGRNFNNRNLTNYSNFSYNTNRNVTFEQQATESMCNIPQSPSIHNLDFYNQNEKKNKKREKSKKSCIIL